MDSNPSLREYIGAYGDENFGRLVGVATTTAASWRRGTRFPKREMSAKIIKATNHRVTLAGIYGPSEPVVFARGRRAKQPPA